jgi:hypothetical protein
LSFGINIDEKSYNVLGKAPRGGKGYIARFHGSLFQALTAALKKLAPPLANAHRKNPFIHIRDRIIKGKLVFHLVGEIRRLLVARVFVATTLDLQQESDINKINLHHLPKVDCLYHLDTPLRHSRAINILLERWKTLDPNIETNYQSTIDALRALRDKKVRVAIVGGQRSGKSNLSHHIIFSS